MFKGSAIIFVGMSLTSQSRLQSFRRKERNSRAKPLYDTEACDYSFAQKKVTTIQHVCQNKRIPCSKKKTLGRRNVI
jgi:hypothetical protein